MSCIHFFGNICTEEPCDLNRQRTLIVGGNAANDVMIELLHGTPCHSLSIANEYHSTSHLSKL